MSETPTAVPGPDPAPVPVQWPPPPRLILKLVVALIKPSILAGVIYGVVLWVAGDEDPVTSAIVFALLMAAVFFVITLVGARGKARATRSGGVDGASDRRPPG